MFFQSWQTRFTRNTIYCQKSCMFEHDIQMHFFVQAFSTWLKAKYNNCTSGENRHKITSSWEILAINIRNHVTSGFLAKESTFSSATVNYFQESVTITIQWNTSLIFLFLHWWSLITFLFFSRSPKVAQIDITSGKSLFPLRVAKEEEEGGFLLPQLLRNQSILNGRKRD